MASKAIAEKLARLTISARGAFPLALATVRGWLQPVEHPDYVVHPLHESGLCRQHPQDALTLLDAIIADQPWAPRKLRECLNDIVQAWPDAHRDNRYLRLIEYARRHEQE